MPEETSMPGLERLAALRQYVMALVLNDLAWHQVIEDEAVRLEAEGYRIVSGGGGGGGPWDITDYRTREVIADGTGGIEEYEEASGRLSAEGRPLYHADHLLLMDFPDPPQPAGMPEGLCRALADWVSGEQDEAVEWLGGEAAIAAGRVPEHPEAS